MNPGTARDRILSPAPLAKLDYPRAILLMQNPYLLLFRSGHVAFYAVDGIDGSGKSTVARIIRDALEAEGRDAVIVEHPHPDGKMGRICAWLLRSENGLARPIIPFLFVSDLMISLIRMRCASSHDDYIFVRYTMSVCYLPDVLSRPLRLLLRAFLPRPDSAVFVDVPVDVALGRIESRDAPRETFENAGDLTSARERMLRMAGEEGWIVLDNDTEQSASAALSSILG